MPAVHPTQIIPASIEIIASDHSLALQCHVPPLPPNEVSETCPSKATMRNEQCLFHQTIYMVYTCQNTVPQIPISPL